MAATVLRVMSQGEAWMTVLIHKGLMFLRILTVGTVASFTEASCGEALAVPNMEMNSRLLPRICSCGYIQFETRGFLTVTLLTARARP